MHSGPSLLQMRSQSLRLANRFPTPYGALVHPLARMNRLVTVPLGRDAGCDAFILQHSAHLVAVITLLAHQGRRPWKIYQQDISTSEVAPLPITQMKPHRTPFLVAHHAELTGQPPLKLT